MATVNKELPQQNTDCVYFLASPLTCKKGSECEFRHSEAARNNPRDCRYWLNGNCLNPKCAFRHPPLDVLVPPQAGSFVGPSPPVPPSGPPVPAKQAVQCIFFQQGFCLKGNICPFLHGPVPPLNTKIRPNPAITAVKEAPTFKKTFDGPKNFTLTKTGFHLTASKDVETPRQPQANVAPKVVTARLTEVDLAVKHYSPPGMIEKTRVDNRSLRSRSARMHQTSSVNDQNYQNRRDVVDSLRESSLGFDVLVDDKLSKDEYYPDEDIYVRTSDREGRRMDELNMGRHDHYNSVADVDRDNYRSKHGYGSYNGLQDEYARGQRGASSERPTANGRRGQYKAKSPDFIQNSSDLRHRLSKQQRGNGLRSVVSPDYKPDYHPEDRGSRGFQRNARSPMRDCTVGSRLKGRIKFPRRSPPVSVVDMYSERDNEKGGNFGRSSPSKSQVSSHQGRLRDRLSGRVQDESIEGRTYRGQMKMDSTIQANGVELTGPKRLLDLKGTKQLTGKQSVSSGELRETVLASSLGTESDISFDGPKPLSEILKRKRKAGITASMDVVNLDNKDGIKLNENNVDTEKQVALSSAFEQTQGDVQVNNEPLTAGGDEEVGEISNKKVKLIEDGSSLPDDEKHPEGEEGLLDGDEEEHEVDEEYDQGDGEYDYEQDDDVEGYDLNEEEVDEGDAVDNEEDFMDEDDGDDFAKKLGVSF